MKKFTKIKCGKLYDGLKAKLQENMEILIEGEKIIEVGRNLACPENTTVIDLLDSTVTPGMIDAHMHTQYFHWKDVYADTVFNSDGYRALATAECARKTLLGGFTTQIARLVQGGIRAGCQTGDRRDISPDHVWSSLLISVYDRKSWRYDASRKKQSYLSDHMIVVSDVKWYRISSQLQ